MNTDQNYIDILQALNKQYDNAPTEQTAQKIIDFVENELNISYDAIMELKEKSEMKIGASILWGMLMLTLVAAFFTKNAGVLFATFFASSITTFYILKFVEKENNKTWKFRHYVVLKKMRNEQKTQDEIAVLEDKYLNNNREIQ